MYCVALLFDNPNNFRKVIVIVNRIKVDIKIGHSTCYLRRDEGREFWKKKLMFYIHSR